MRNRDETETPDTSPCKRPRIAEPVEQGLNDTFDTTRIWNSTGLAIQADQVWQWCGDDGVYVPHDPAAAAEIEGAFQAGFARITVMSLVPLDLEVIVTLKVFQPSLSV
jgi:hypothetical protein